jgi:hypothetical protein
MITVVLNVYKRLNSLETQIRSIKEQSVKPKKIFIWNNSGRDISVKDKNIIQSSSSFNLGVWARFAYALNAKTKYVAIFDDDTIPGRKWFENCLSTIQRNKGLLGTRGVRFSSKKKYIVGEEYGWNHPNETTKKVDIVGHCWFFEREWLSIFWRELPSLKQSLYVGEDIHFSYLLKKYLNLNTYVPPHPKNNHQLWGSLPEYALKFGVDNNAISYDPKRQNEMNSVYLDYIKKGFQINPSTYTKASGFIKDTKSLLGKKIKKIIRI